MKPQLGRIWSITAAMILGLMIAGSMLRPDAPATSVIVQGQDLESTARAVRDAGGTITHELGIIDSVAAAMTPDEVRELEILNPTLRIHENRGETDKARECYRRFYEYWKDGDMTESGWRKRGASAE